MSDSLKPNVVVNEDFKKLENDVGLLMSKIAELHEIIKARPNETEPKVNIDEVAGRAAKMTKDLLFPVPKYGNGEGEVNLILFMKKVAREDLDLKTVYSVNDTTAAQGGYVVPTAFSKNLIEIGLNASQLYPLCSRVPMNSWKTDVPSQLTDVSVEWLAENGAPTIQLPTLTKITLVMGKITAYIAYTDEFLMNDQVNLSNVYERRIGFKTGIAIDNKILNGDADSDIADGLINATGVNELDASSVKATLDYDHFVKLPFQVSTVSYRTNARWVMNDISFQAALLIKNANGDPLLGRLQDGYPKTIQGYPYILSDQVSGAGTTASKTTIFFGDFSNAWFLPHAKFTDMVVQKFDQAVYPATGSLTQNAALHGQKHFRFDTFCGYSIANPTAFARLINVVKK